MFINKRPIYIAAILLFTTLYVKAAINQQRQIIAYNSALTDQSQELEKSNEDTSSITNNPDLITSDTEVKIIRHIVNSTDTIESIANIYKVSVNTILNSNELSKDAQIKEGQALEFPSIPGVLYKVKNGETIWDLALQNKVDINKIIEINKLDTPDKLKLDQKIIFPEIDKVASITSNRSSSDSATTENTTSTKKLVASSQTISRGSMPTRGTITSRYGERWGRQHEGIDIAAPTGTNVYAFMDGKVIFSGWQGAYGNLVIISHGNGLKSYYGHNSKNVVKTGQVVKKGTHIAEVGSTGRSTGPHTHFEVRKNDVPVNPFNYIQ